MKWISTTAFLGCLGTATAFAPTTRLSPTTPASLTTRAASRRDIVVDLATGTLIGILSLAGAPLLASAERPAYLTDPTEEFKDNEAKSAEFKRGQLALKKDFVELLDKFAKDPSNEAVLEKDLRAFQSLVIKARGLPLGIKKEDFYKQIRTKKAAGFWPTSVEVA
jgi:hypothetical protein